MEVLLLSTRFVQAPLSPYVGTTFSDVCAKYATYWPINFRVTQFPQHCVSDPFLTAVPTTTLVTGCLIRSILNIHPHVDTLMLSCGLCRPQRHSPPHTTCRRSLHSPGWRRGRAPPPLAIFAANGRPSLQILPRVARYTPAKARARRSLVHLARRNERPCVGCNRCALPALSSRPVSLRGTATEPGERDSLDDDACWCLVKFT